MTYNELIIKPADIIIDKTDVELSGSLKIKGDSWKKFCHRTVMLQRSPCTSAEIPNPKPVAGGNISCIALPEDIAELIVHKRQRPVTFIGSNQ